VSVAIVLVFGVLAGCGGTSASEPSVADLTGYVQVPGPPLSAPRDLSVTETDGSTWRYDHAVKGRITLLYFGYTSCPDVCPTTMADLASALGKVRASVRDRVVVQFVSSDPVRDTATQIRSWLGQFDPTFHGGRAPIDDVIAAARSYGISIKAPVSTKGDYQVTHGAQLLVLRPGGGAVGYFNELAGPQAYRAALPVLVRRYASS
jgi:protein SCO1/2